MCLRCAWECGGEEGKKLGEGLKKGLRGGVVTTLGECLREGQGSYGENFETVVKLKKREKFNPPSQSKPPPSQSNPPSQSLL